MAPVTPARSTRPGRILQATVRRYDAADRSGEALDDSGGLHRIEPGTLDPAVRHLRPGQRVRLEWSGQTLDWVTVAALPGPAGARGRPAGDGKIPS